MENLREIIANNIIDLRKQKGLTQVGLAKKVNYSDKAISRWENKEVVPDVETLQTLSKVFDVPITYFFDEHKIDNKASVISPSKNDIIFLLSIICSIWTIVSIIFVYAQIIYNFSFWQIFVWGAPVTCSVGIYMSIKWRLRIGKAIWKSLFNWSLIAAIYLQFISLNIWLIFIIGVPLQASIIIASLKKAKSI